MTSRRPRKHVDDLRAATKLVVHATTGVTDVVEDMHRAIASGPAILGEPLVVPARLLTKLVYGPVRAVTRFVGSAIDRTLAELAPFLGESEPGPAREAAVAALNGVLGDYLAAIESPLALEMELRQRGDAPVGSKVLVLVHGSAMTDGQWTRLGHDHGEALAKDLGYTAVYVRYNSGLHVAENGRTLARLLDELVSAWPVPIEELAILGFSMGGLVARSACRVAELEDRPWRKKLQKLVCLGTPHHGSPLERGGSWVDVLLGVTKYSAPLARLGKIRSAGVTDLRFGSVLDGDGDRFVPLPAGVACFAIAGSTAPAPCPRPPGDGLVPVDSALGRHRKSSLRLAFPDAHQWIAFGAGHLDLLARRDVYATIKGWLAAAPAS